MNLGQEVIVQRLVSYSVNIRSGSSIVNGKIIPTYLSVNVSLAVIPFNFKTLKYLPEGFYTLQDVKVYEAGTTSLTKLSQFVYNGDTYEVKDIMDREEDGGFTEYLCKRLEE